MLLAPFAETLALVHTRDIEQGVVLNRFLIDCLHGVLPDWESLDILDEQLKQDCKNFYALGSKGKFGIRYFDGREFKNILHQCQVYPKGGVFATLLRFFGFGIYTSHAECYLDTQGHNYAKVGIKRVCFGSVWIFLALWLFFMTHNLAFFNLYLGLSLVVILYGANFLYWYQRKVMTVQVDFDLLERECMDKRIVRCLKRFARIDKVIYDRDIKYLENAIIGEMCCVHDDICELRSMRGLLGDAEVQKRIDNRNDMLSSYEKTHRILVALRNSSRAVNTVQA